MTDYAEWTEHYAGMGYDGSDAARFAGTGVRPDNEEEEDETDLQPTPEIEQA